MDDDDYKLIKKEIYKHGDDLTCIAFDQTNKILYSGHKDCSIKSWEIVNSDKVVMRKIGNHR